jgi:hypothetical protein
MTSWALSGISMRLQGIGTRFLLVGCLLFGLSGCGTINSVFVPDPVVVATLKWSQTNCAALPRVFSGVAYDFCVLNGPPRAGDPDHKSDPGGMEFIVFDILASAVFDVVLLPYTAYSQVAHGNLELY